MSRFVLASTLVLLLAGAVSAGDEEPPSERDVWFRMEVGVEPGRIVTVRLVDDEPETSGYDRALLDLDGDGEAETVQEFGRVRSPRPGRSPLDPKVTVEHEDATWVLDLRYSRLQWSGDRASAWIRWSVTKDGFYAWFINGRAAFAASAEAAAEEKAIRLGPPFRFETDVATRGRQALVRIGLKDASGATLRLARRDRTQTRPRLRLLTGEGEEAFAAWASYG